MLQEAAFGHARRYFLQRKRLRLQNVSVAPCFNAIMCFCPASDFLRKKWLSVAALYIYRCNRNGFRWLRYTVMGIGNAAPRDSCMW